MSESKLDCEVLSCIQPTGEVHIGNYFGAIKKWVELQDTKQCIYGIVDLHAMTGKSFDQNLLRQRSNQMMIDLLACGIDPQKSLLFVQSLVPEHLELAWVLGSIASFGELSRQTQFKDKFEKSKTTKASVPVGLFTYPILQAADILIYKAKSVPVGKDQKQHLELTRNLAQRFNNQFGEYFPIPEPKYSDVPKVMSFSDPQQKMSKSLGDKHFIRLFEEEAVLRKKVMSAVTDSGDTKEGELSEGVKNLFDMLNACGKENATLSMMNDFHNGNLKYKLLKETVADALVELTSDMRQRRATIENDVSLISDVIREMSGRARVIAQKNLYDVKQMVGMKNISHF